MDDDDDEQFEKRQAMVVVVAVVTVLAELEVVLRPMQPNERPKKVLFVNSQENASLTRVM